MTTALMMDTSDPPAPILSNNTKVVTSKASSMQRTVHVVQMVAQKSCRRVCQMLSQMFCCPVDSLHCQKVTCCHQLSKDKTTQGALHNSPSTILIFNISNSTLIDCIIGSDAYPSAVAESQPLMRDSSNLQMQGRARCSCWHEEQEAAHTSAPSCPLTSAEHPSISIHSSHLNCVIIGNNNYMQAEQTHLTETEEPQE